jgi:hypothetical protein
MKPYGISRSDSSTCVYGCCHSRKAASKHINVAGSTDGARQDDFKPIARRHGRGRARAENRRARRAWREED